MGAYVMQAINEIVLAASRGDCVAKGRRALAGALAFSLATHLALGAAASSVSHPNRRVAVAEPQPIVVSLTESQLAPASIEALADVPQPEHRSHRTRPPRVPRPVEALAEVTAPVDPVVHASNETVGNLLVAAAFADGRESGATGTGAPSAGVAVGLDNGEPRGLSGTGNVARAGSVDLELVRASYLGRIRAELSRCRRYPYQAKRLGIEGTVYLRFSIGRNGSTGQVAFARGTTDAELRAAALESLRAASPFEPPPPELGSGLTVEVPISFVLEEPR